MKIIFFGSDDFALAHLDALVEKGFEVELCVTQPDRPRHRGQKVIVSPIKEYAIEKNIAVYQPESLKSKAVIKHLKSLEADLFVVIAYGRILPQDLLDIPKVMSINVHGSLLPAYRGAAPINWVIINGEQMTGITIMRLNAGMDAGDIIDQVEVQINLDDDASSLRQRMIQAGVEQLPKTVQAIIDQQVKFSPQDDTKVTFAPKLTKELGKIDWSKSAQQIHNLARGLVPWPSAYTHVNGKSLKIYGTKVIDHLSGQPGEIIKIDDSGMQVSTGKGGLLIKEVHPESAKRMKVEDFVRGARIEVGYILG